MGAAPQAMAMPALSGEHCSKGNCQKQHMLTIIVHDGCCVVEVHKTLPDGRRTELALSTQHTTARSFNVRQEQRKMFDTGKSTLYRSSMVLVSCS
jgi:hypothetical protein